ncbi:Actin-like protein [Oleoguttula mirabilis]|uniref:Actin-like protein n=1 Tax=Oleoguttula mirabilis TaxID=1507867 RepID=A0AAV9J647_9PEZI|nr:Actin-like protein [Oleoguttula mirabilis]
MADLHNTPIVIDNGSGTIRAGYAGEDLPKCFFPSFVGRPKHLRVLAGGLEGDVFIGNRAQELRGLLKLRYPLAHGIVTDWDDMERIWQYIYTDELKTLSEEHPVLLTEAPLNPRANRDTAAQILFETFNVPALYTSIQAVLSLYASGRTTGIVLDAGDGVSHAVPVYEGFAIPSSIRRIDVAGRDITEHLQTLLRKQGSVFHTSAEKEIVKQIKEKTTYIALDPKKEEKEWLAASNRGGGGGSGGADSKAVEYTLPDGQKLKIGSERFRAPEILFDPEIIGLEYPGLHQLVVDAIGRTDMDLRKALFGNIVLSGGSTMIKGFGDRLLHEVQRLAVKDMRIKIFAPPERLYSTWIGGSILAGLSTFRKMYVGIEEWHESKSGTPFSSSSLVIWRLEIEWVCGEGDVVLTGGHADPEIIHQKFA